MSHENYDFIASLSISQDGQAPGKVNAPEEYDEFFRISREEVSDLEWATQTLNFSDLARIG